MVYKHTRSSEFILGRSPIQGQATGLKLWFDDFDTGSYADKDKMAQGYDYQDWDNLVASYVDDPDGRGANRYSYVGETIEYDGGTYYLWRMDEGGDGYSSMVMYMITDTIDFDTLYANSLEDNPENEYTPYVALLGEDMGEYRNNSDSQDWLIKVVNG